MTRRWELNDERCVDGLSELNQATRNKLRPLDPEFAANALIVTSRIEEALDGVEKTIIHPMRIGGDRLSSFMEAYLVLGGRRALFRDAEFFDGCRKLSVMVGDRDTTVLLAKIFAEQMISSRANAEQKLPENIPDLMLQYLNELNRKEGLLTDRAVHSAAKSVAWECLKETFRPAPAKIEAVLATLGGDSAQDRINYLERNLRLVQVIGTGRDRVKFALDPLAEYLAGLYAVEHYGGNEQLWTDFLAKTPGWSKVVMVEPTGMKLVKLIGRPARSSHRARMSAASTATTVTKPWRLRPMHSGSAVRECVRIVAAHGAILEGSGETPFTLQDGSTMMDADMISEELLTDSVRCEPTCRGETARRIHSRNAYNAVTTAAVDSIRQWPSELGKPKRWSARHRRAQGKTQFRRCASRI